MIDLDGRHFSPVSNSKGGRVDHDSIFIFAQSGNDFTASYQGKAVSDGHIIGKMTGANTATIIYHARAATGELEAGEAEVVFTVRDNQINIEMTWRWLNGSKSAGTSKYREIT